MRIDGDFIIDVDTSGICDSPEGYHDVTRVRADLTDGSALCNAWMGSQYRALVLVVLLDAEGARTSTQLAQRLHWNAARVREPLRKLRAEGAITRTERDVYVLLATGRERYLRGALDISAPLA